MNMNVMAISELLFKVRKSFDSESFALSVFKRVLQLIWLSGIGLPLADYTSYVTGSIHGCSQSHLTYTRVPGGC